MKISKILRRFLLPRAAVSLVCWVKYGAKVSPRSEVELSPFLSLGKGTDIGSFSKIKSADGPMEIGSEVMIGVFCFLASDAGGVRIGDYGMIGPNAAIVGNNYRYDDLGVPICRQEKTSKGIRIGQNVWIGAGCVVLDGANIGNGVILTPNTVVASRIPDNTIVQGNPGKVIFTRR